MLTVPYRRTAMPTKRNAKKRNGDSAKKARLYHFSDRTIRQLDALGALCGSKERAVAYAIDATYQAAGAALRKLKVKRIPLGET
jgi:hypothetical protein